MNRTAVPALRALALAGALVPVFAAAQPAREVFRCPGNPVLYTDALTAKEAIARGCRTLEGAPITVVQTPRPAPSAAPAPRNVAAPSTAPGTGARSSDERVSATEQRARDSDARRILEAELRREEDRLAALQREYNGGEPERRGDERNYQKYLDRVAELKAGIQRKEADIAAIRRELGKLPP